VVVVGDASGFADVGVFKELEFGFGGCGADGDEALVADGVDSSVSLDAMHEWHGSVLIRVASVENVALMRVSRN